MPPIQSDYPETMPRGVAGWQNNMVPSTLISRTLEGDVELPFGSAVAQGVADKGCVPFGVGSTAVLGIAIVDRSARGENGDGFAPKESVRIMTKGAVLVVATVAVVAGNPVFVRPSNNTFQPTNANSAVQIAGARFETSADAGELAEVRLV